MNIRYDAKTLNPIWEQMKFEAGRDKQGTKWKVEVYGAPVGYSAELGLGQVDQGNGTMKSLYRARIVKEATGEYVFESAAWKTKAAATSKLLDALRLLWQVQEFKNAAGKRGPIGRAEAMGKQAGHDA